MPYMVNKLHGNYLSSENSSDIPLRILSSVDSTTIPDPFNYPLEQTSAVIWGTPTNALNSREMVFNFRSRKIPITSFPPTARRCREMVFNFRLNKVSIPFPEIKIENTPLARELVIFILGSERCKMERDI